MSDLRINLSRLKSRLDAVNQIGALPGGGVKRLALTEEDGKVRDLLKHWFEEMQLTYKVDQMGNMWGTWKAHLDREPVFIGSHLDTVGTGGCFDGSLGVVAALEVQETLAEAGFEPSRPLAVINFTNEEGVRFTPDMMGSYAFAGLGKLDELWNARAEEDTQITLSGELKRLGYLGDEPCGKHSADSYFELHVEQGPVLEKEQLNIGVVQKVQGIFWTELILKGTANHAGTTPMSMRRDAGYVAARINTYVRELTQSPSGTQVGTVGITSFFPNLINVVPEQVRLTIDLRNTDKEELVRSQSALEAFVTEVTNEEGINYELHELVRFDPVDFDKDMIATVKNVSEKLGYTHRMMPSGAGHDAQMMASLCPATMIFVPSKDGVSHNVTEYTSDEDIEKGANVLLHAVIDRLSK